MATRSLVWGALLYAATLTPAASRGTYAASIDVGSASGAAGQQVTFEVTLSTMGKEVAGSQNDINFDPINTPIASRTSGKPDCTVNANINKDATLFGFRPPGCSTGAGTCNAVRVLVIADDNVEAIPDGSVLYTCRVNISDTAVLGRYALSTSGLSLSDSSGSRVSATGSDGEIEVLPNAPPSATPTMVPSTPTPRCFGDCNSDGAVTVDELITMVSLALGSGGVTGCGPGDINHDSEITIDEILTAVNNALNECSTSPPPTAIKLTPTSTPPAPPLTNTPRPSPSASDTPTRPAARTSTPTATVPAGASTCETGQVDCIVIEAAENVEAPDPITGGTKCRLRLQLRNTSRFDASLVFIYDGFGTDGLMRAAVLDSSPPIAPGGTQTVEGDWSYFGVSAEGCSEIASCGIDRGQSVGVPCL